MEADGRGLAALSRRVGGSSADGAARWLSCCLALGRTRSRGGSAACPASRGSADGGLKGRAGVLLCRRRVGSTPGSAGECGAGAGLRSSCLEVSTLCLFSDPQGVFRHWCGLSHTEPPPPAVALAGHGSMTTACPGMELGLPPLPVSRRGDTHGANKLVPCHAQRRVYEGLVAQRKRLSLPEGSIPWLFITSHIWSSAAPSLHPGTPGFG